jgi:hypothetical protein
LTLQVIAPVAAFSLAEDGLPGDKRHVRRADDEHGVVGRESDVIGSTAQALGAGLVVQRDGRVPDLRAGDVVQDDGVAAVLKRYSDVRGVAGDPWEDVEAAFAGEIDLLAPGDRPAGRQPYERRERA